MAQPLSTQISRQQSAQIADFIVQRNPRFELVIEQSGLCPIGVKPSGSQKEKSKPRESNFAALASSILSQQLSTKAAATIIKRVETLSGGSLSAKKLSEVPIGALRESGCSNSKARAVKELALAETTKQVPMRTLHLLSDDEIMAHLLPLFGIGKWTVEMFLMFQLGRLDIWPVGDLGVRRGWERVHRMRSEIEPNRLMQIGNKYSPYRSHLAWYCWRANEVLPSKKIAKKPSAK